MLRPRFLFLLVLPLLFVASAAEAGIYLLLETNTQGVIDGDALLQGEEDRIVVDVFDQVNTFPFDPGTGQIGREEIGPLVFGKSFDPATIPMIQAMGNRERVTEFELHCYQPDGQGVSVHYLTVLLEDAYLTKRTTSTTAVSSSVSESEETWEVVFRRITWRDEITGAEYSQTTDGSTSVTEPLARNFELAPAPNPTSGRTTFSFRLPETGHVSIDVYDLRGRRVAQVFDGPTLTTQSAVEWNGTDDAGQAIAPGIYLVKMRTGEWLTTRKLSVIR